MIKKYFILCRTFLIFYILCICSIQSTAQTELLIVYNNDTEESFIINEAGRLYFDGSILIIDEGDQFPISISVSDIRKITIPSNNTVSVPQNNDDNKIFIYPNPASDYITIGNIGSNKVNIKLFSISGQLLSERYYMPNEQINISNLPSGLYILKTDEKTLKFSKL